MNEWKFHLRVVIRAISKIRHYVFFAYHTSACYGCTFSGALAPQPPRQVESRKMQRLLPETAMKELHSQARGRESKEEVITVTPKGASQVSPQELEELIGELVFLICVFVFGCFQK